MSNEVRSQNVIIFGGETNFPSCAIRYGESRLSVNNYIVAKRKNKLRLRIVVTGDEGWSGEACSGRRKNYYRSCTDVTVGISNIWWFSSPMVEQALTAQDFKSPDYIKRTSPKHRRWHHCFEGDVPPDALGDASDDPSYLSEEKNYIFWQKLL